MKASQLLEFPVFKLPDLPYGYDALQPAMSAETLHLHHDKHHAAYVKTVNELVPKEGLKPQSLEDLVVQAKQAGKAKLFDNAAQAWNHAFFWNCMSPGGKTPTGEIEQAIAKAFGGSEQLKSQFVEAGVGHFGSGWVWIVADGQTLKLITTHDGENTLDQPGLVPILTCDLWEHAYYVDYQNDRKGFLETWFDALPDWEFVAHQLQAARGGGKPWRYPAPEAEPILRQA
ncbi:MAG TPA: superoxide dismutase [Caulobacteraceae bacterium]